MVGPILDDHAADGSPYARRCLILGLILAWLISPAYVTFRCEVLSEGKTVAHRRYYASLNTPFGARYFPTRRLNRDLHTHLDVSMHLLVLGAFRRDERRDDDQRADCVSMHLLVLGAFRLIIEDGEVAS